MTVRARVAVIGGGAAGCSVLYHLAKLGCDNLVLLEASELTSGSTWHAAGLCTQFHHSYNLMKLLRYSVTLYDSILEAETGQPTGYHRCGSIRLAATPTRIDELYHRRAMAKAAGIPFEIIEPERVAELFPLAAIDGVAAAAWLPTDGHVDPSGITRALARGAGQRAKAGIRSVVNGPDGYTPDGLCLMGPVPGLRNFHVLAGLQHLRDRLQRRCREIRGRVGSERTARG